MTIRTRSNLRKHGLRFETARLVFDDALAVSRRDAYPDEERWQTMGLIGPVVVVVVHTFAESNLGGGEEGGRIISARKATGHERKTYEEGDF